MASRQVSLNDKYTARSGRIFLTGTQALTRLPIMQRQLDSGNGLHTAGFVSGYRGSPVAGLDKELWRAQELLKQNHIHFQPGVNEDLAATAIWGTQQVNLFEGVQYDGVFGMWYGKGPGVDRSGDVLKHGNAAGSSPHGGVLLIAGDDHGAKSSSLAHQSEFAMADAMIPVLNPAGVQEILDFGLYGWAVSRFSGCWVALKVVTELVNSSASVYVDSKRIQIATPENFEVPPGGLNIRWPDTPVDQELRLHEHKIKAAVAFARANWINRVLIDSPRARFGIVTAGKSYLDVRQVLEEFGIDEKGAAEIGIRLFKVGMTWPLDPDGIRQFAKGLDEILVIEEKRSLLESQIKEILYALRHDNRPTVVGKQDETGATLLPSSGGLTPELIARALAERLGRFHSSDRIRQRIAYLDLQERPAGDSKIEIQRIPYFCSGCPHNTSTRVPEGSRAIAGVGCHYMVNWMDRSTSTFTHMGGEGATWLGQAPFAETSHVFQNLGDGTYFHSGALAIRAALAAKVNITYKILFNDAVAMTGGQPIDGQLTVPQLSRQLHAEGVRHITVVTDEPGKYDAEHGFAPGVTVHHRKALDRIQREFREISGVSVIIYDQACAAEKRRKRKWGAYPDPARRLFINEMVCEGCGDCGTRSNCLSVVPVGTEFGTKRAIDQSSCNKDYTCLDGFCPSFVTVRGGRIRRRVSPDVALDGGDLPEPKPPELDTPYDIVITGVGGTGVVTTGAVLGMAAHIEGKGCSILDMAGLAQKGGAVVSHLRIAARPEDIHAVQIGAGNARLLLGCDLVVSAAREVLGKTRKGITQAMLNSHEAAVGAFTQDPDLTFPGKTLRDAIGRAVGPGNMRTLDMTSLAKAVFGDAILANVIMLGYAYQLGHIPLSAESIIQTIEMSHIAVEENKRAFFLGRLAAHNPAAVKEWLAPPNDPPAGTGEESLKRTTSRRAEFLTGYQDAALAERYERLIHHVRSIEAEKTGGRTALAEAAARNYFKLLAYKDEYEVARLYSDGTFLEQLEKQFEGDYRLTFHFAPPLFPSRDPETGELRKRTFGRWMLPVLRLMARFKFLRGTALDIFGYTAERRMERQLIRDFETRIEEVLQHLKPENHAAAVEIAENYKTIRGFGHIKTTQVAIFKQRENELLADFHGLKIKKTALV